MSTENIFIPSSYTNITFYILWSQFVSLAFLLCIRFPSAPTFLISSVCCIHLIPAITYGLANDSSGNYPFYHQVLENLRGQLVKSQFCDGDVLGLNPNRDQVVKPLTFNGEVMVGILTVTSGIQVVCCRRSAGIIA